MFYILLARKTQITYRLQLVVHIKIRVSPGSLMQHTRATKEDKSRIKEIQYNKM